MMRSRKKTCACFMLTIMLSLLFPVVCSADELYFNEIPGHIVLIQDDAGLLTDAERAELGAAMQKAAPYGNAVFLTVQEDTGLSTREIAESTYRNHFNRSDGVIFVIDMNNRELWISGFGTHKDVIDNYKCETITDNVYTYATDGDYYTCGQRAFSQITALLQGDRIPQPMKYICSYLFSLILAMFVVYFYVLITSRKRGARQKETERNTDYHCYVTNPNVQFLRETRTYSPQSSETGGGGGSSFGSSGGGGGSDCSGGGHGF